MDEPGHRERESFFRAAKVVAGLTLLSRVFGMVRAMSITWLGAASLTDAFQIAFFLPNLFRRLFGEGVLSAAFIPVFTDTFEKSGQPSARRLLANALGLLAAFLSVLMLLLLAGLLIWLWWSELSEPGRHDRQYLVLFAGIMLPFMVLVCMLALSSAALNCRGHFAYPAAAPIDGLGSMRPSPVFQWQVDHGVVPASATQCLPVQPVQLYEAAASFFIFGILLLFYPHRRRYGEVTCLFGTLYPFVRFFFEFVRQPESILVLGLTPEQVFSIITFVGFATVFVISRKKQPAVAV
jgi:hypothetical protein